uniref:Fanconi anemia group M protein n=1 Tax=Chaetoceros debilis TaxID=122233 RepID=A0A7S3QF60_9STRA
MEVQTQEKSLYAKEGSKGSAAAAEMTVVNETETAVLASDDMEVEVNQQVKVLSNMNPDEELAGRAKAMNKEKEKEMAQMSKKITDTTKQSEGTGMDVDVDVDVDVDRMSDNAGEDSTEQDKEKKPYVQMQKEDYKEEPKQSEVLENESTAVMDEAEAMDGEASKVSTKEPAVELETNEASEAVPVVASDSDGMEALALNDDSEESLLPLKLVRHEVSELVVASDDMEACASNSNARTSEESLQQAKDKEKPAAQMLKEYADTIEQNNATDISSKCTDQSSGGGQASAINAIDAAEVFGEASKASEDVVATDDGMGEAASASASHHPSSNSQNQLTRGYIPGPAPLAHNHNTNTNANTPQQQPLTWIYPTSTNSSYSERQYQLEITRTALSFNTLVSLPTGLGKTLISAVVMYNYYRWFPTGKVVFLAPTCALVNQQIQACYNIMGIPELHTAEMTGKTIREKRGRLWKERRLFFCTPQTMEGDLRSDNCDGTRVVCIVFDEAHKAVKEYAYVKVLQQLNACGARFRVLALSATPGKDIATIQTVIQTLNVSRIEARWEEDEEVKRYTHTVEKEIMYLEPTEDVHMGIRLFDKVLDPILNQIRERGGLRQAGLQRNTTVTSHGMRMEYNLMVEQRNDFSLKAFQQPVGTLLRAREALKEHDVRIARTKLIAFASSAGHNSSIGNKITSSKEYLQLWKTVVDGAPLPIEDVKRNNPKLQKVDEMLREHFERARACGKGDTKAIIFSTLRESVQEIVSVLQSAAPLVRAVKFVGRSTTNKDEVEDVADGDDDNATTTGKKSFKTKGMTSDEQKKTIENFRNGIHNVLVCTSIGEEGLDIGATDLIINFDCLRSPLRMVQREGRTGRSRAGRVICLVYRGQEEKKLRESEAQTRTLWRTLRNTNGFHLAKNVPLLPEKPVLERRDMQVRRNEYRMSQIGGLTQKAKKKRKKRINNGKRGNGSSSALDDDNTSRSSGSGWRLTESEELERQRQFGTLHHFAKSSNQYLRKYIKAWKPHSDLRCSSIDRSTSTSRSITVAKRKKLALTLTLTSIRAKKARGIGLAAQALRAVEALAIPRVEVEAEVDAEVEADSRRKYRLNSGRGGLSLRMEHNGNNDGNGNASGSGSDESVSEMARMEYSDNVDDNAFQQPFSSQEVEDDFCAFIPDDVSLSDTSNVDVDVNVEGDRSSGQVLLNYDNEKDDSGPAPSKSNSSQVTPGESLGTKRQSQRHNYPAPVPSSISVQMKMSDDIKAILFPGGHEKYAVDPPPLEAPVCDGDGEGEGEMIPQMKMKPMILDYDSSSSEEGGENNNDNNDDNSCHEERRSPYSSLVSKALEGVDVDVEVEVPLLERASNNKESSEPIEVGDEESLETAKAVIVCHDADASANDVSPANDCEQEDSSRTAAAVAPGGPHDFDDAPHNNENEIEPEFHGNGNGFGTDSDIAPIQQEQAGASCTSSQNRSYSDGNKNSSKRNEDQDGEEVYRKIQLQEAIRPDKDLAISSDRHIYVSEHTVTMTTNARSGNGGILNDKSDCLGTTEAVICNADAVDNGVDGDAGDGNADADSKHNSAGCDADSAEVEVEVEVEQTFCFNLPSEQEDNKATDTSSSSDSSDCPEIVVVNNNTNNTAGNNVKNNANANNSAGDSMEEEQAFCFDLPSEQEGNKATDTSSSSASSDYAEIEVVNNNANNNANANNSTGDSMRVEQAFCFDLPSEEEGNKATDASSSDDSSDCAETVVVNNNANNNANANNSTGDSMEAEQAFCFDLPSQDTSSSSSDESCSDSDSDQISDQNVAPAPVRNDKHDESTLTSAIQDDASVHPSQKSFSVDLSLSRTCDGDNDITKSAPTESSSPMKGSASEIEQVDPLSSEGNNDSVDSQKHHICTTTIEGGESEKASEIIHLDSSQDFQSPAFRRTSCIESSRAQETPDEETPNLNIRKRSNRKTTFVDPFLTQFSPSPSKKSQPASTIKQTSALVQGLEDSQDAETPHLNRSRLRKSSSKVDPFLTQHSSSSSHRKSRSQSTSTPSANFSEQSPPIFTPTSSHQTPGSLLQDTPMQNSAKRQRGESHQQSRSIKRGVTKKTKVDRLLAKANAKRRRKNKYGSCKFLDIEAEADSEDEDSDEFDNEVGLSQDSFINDSSQLGFTQDELDTLHCDEKMMLSGNSADHNALRRQVDNEMNRDSIFATPILKRNRNQSTQDLSVPSSEKNLGKMHFIRSVIEHHKRGGDADQIENEYHNIIKLNGGESGTPQSTSNSNPSESQQEMSGSQCQHSSIVDKSQQSSGARCKVANMPHDPPQSSSQDRSDDASNIGGRLRCKSVLAKDTTSRPLRTSRLKLQAPHNPYTRPSRSNVSSQAGQMTAASLSASLSSYSNLNNPGSSHPSQPDTKSSLTVEQRARITASRQEALLRRQARMKKK